MASSSDIAKAMNLTPRRVQQLVQEGLPKAERGQYKLGECMAWYIRYLQKALQARQSPEGKEETIEWTKDRSRLARAQARLAELKVAETEGDLVSVAAMEQGLGELLAEFKTNVLSFPSKIAPELEGQTAAEREATLQTIAIGLLERLSAWDPFDVSRPGARRHASATGGAETTAEADDQPVG